jgi:predicted regulator of Ras-like GTPase activity (Roadblock/LC7/MglB family)
MVVSDGKGQLLSALARALEPVVRVARRTGPEAPREQGRGEGAPSIGRAEMGAMAAVLRRLGGSAGVQAAVVASLDGTVVADWQRTSELDVAELAPLAAGSLVATLQVGRLLGSRGLSSLMLQEHDGLLVMIARLRETHLLLLAVEGEAAVGPLRLAMRRTIERLGGLLPAPRQREGAFAD